MQSISVIHAATKWQKLLAEVSLLIFFKEK